MLVFVKLGGSLITDKTREAAFRAERMAAIARAIAEAQTADPSLELLIGHGSGSFGHFAASKYGTARGVRTDEEWAGFAEVARAAAALNRLVAEALGSAGIPAWTLQPSATADCERGELRYLDTRPIQAALQRGVVPLVHGDVALDSEWGGTIISTESVFFYLAPILLPRHIFLFGEVRGVLNSEDIVLPVITPDSLPDIECVLGGSHGTDVTGGMASKVHDMVLLAQAIPGLRIHILSGSNPEIVRESLLNPDHAPGTVIMAG